MTHFRKKLRHLLIYERDFLSRKKISKIKEKVRERIIRDMVAKDSLTIFNYESKS